MEKYFSEESFKQLYIDSVKNCKAKLKQTIQANNPLYNFTDHSVTHSERIEKKLLKLYKDIFENKDATIRLNDVEVYILIMSIYLHDIGMELMNRDSLIKLFEKRTYRNPFIQSLVDKITIEEIIDKKKDDKAFYEFIRKNHHIISALWILKSETPGELELPILGGFAYYIALVCFAHNEEVDVLRESYYNNTSFKGEVIELKVLAYLLRMGDALDGDRDRVNIAVKDIKDIPLISRIHWYRHYFTKSILTQDRSITVTFEFPEEDELGEEIEKYFKENTRLWLDINIDDLIKRKILQSSIRNKFLKCTLEIEQDSYNLIKSIDKEVRKEISSNLVKDKMEIVLSKKKNM